MTTTPRRIEWAGPEGWTVWADEDGAHLRTPHGDCLEACDVTRLIELIHEVRTQIADGTVPAPKPPTREQIREMGWPNREKQLAHVAAKAVRDAIEGIDVTVRTQPTGYVSGV